MIGRRLQDKTQNKRDETLSNVPTDEVQLLIKLVTQVTNQSTLPAESSQQEEAQEVILDKEVDGMRYRLLRTPSRNDKAQVTLSPREQEIARMVAEGYPNKTIAAVLDISSWTVCTHLRRIFAKLNVRSRAAMVARLLEEGLMGEQPKNVEAARKDR
jgi:DNA-binding NarL/FixJ family response regulator